MAAPRRGGDLREAAPQPAPLLQLGDAVAIVVGIVVGAGIFRSPSLVASQSGGSPAVFMTAWLVGGLVSLIGALCYAELASTYPHAGGDYYYLKRAYGPRLSFLYAWARISVTQTGSIALLSFVFGDYATQVLPLGPYSSSIYAAAVVVLLTLLHVLGVRRGAVTQNFLTSVEVGGLLILIATGLLLPFFTGGVAPAAAGPAGGGSSSLGLAMVFVLLTYGGWNEAAYVSAELRDARRQIGRALILSICVITALYLLANWAYLRVLGLDAIANSQTVAADLMSRAFGPLGARLISLLIAVSALTSASATVFTGARTNFAVGRDFVPFRPMGRWSARLGTPATALAVQGCVALALVALGTFTRKGFETMVDYTAPIFWLFFLLTGVALFVLRRRDPGRERGFSVPLYPLTPLVFCLSSAYLLYSSLAYARVGALVGVSVLVVGVLLLLVVGRGPEAETATQPGD